MGTPQNEAGKIENQVTWVMLNKSLNCSKYQFSHLSCLWRFLLHLSPKLKSKYIGVNRMGRHDFFWKDGTRQGLLSSTVEEWCYEEKFCSHQLAIANINYQFPKGSHTKCVPSLSMVLFTLPAQLCSLSPLLYLKSFSSSKPSSIVTSSLQPF